MEREVGYNEYMDNMKKFEDMPDDIATHIEGREVGYNEYMNSMIKKFENMSQDDIIAYVKDRGMFLRFDPAGQYSLVRKAAKKLADKALKEGLVKKNIDDIGSAIAKMAGE